MSDDIAKLEETADNLSALSERWADKGEDEKALELSNQAVALRDQITQLKAKRRADMTASPEWAALAGHMDALNAQAQKTSGDLEDVMGNIETAKSLVSGLTKLVTLL